MLTHSPPALLSALTLCGILFLCSSSTACQLLYFDLAALPSFPLLIWADGLESLECITNRLIFRLIWASRKDVVFDLCAACFMVPESTSEDSRVAARAAAEQIRLQNPTGPGALLSSLLSTWSIVMRSRLFLTLTVIMMMVGIVQEGIQDLIMQYLQIKVHMASFQPSCIPSTPHPSTPHSPSTVFLALAMLSNVWTALSHLGVVWSRGQRSSDAGNRHRRLGVSALPSSPNAVVDG